MLGRFFRIIAAIGLMALAAGASASAVVIKAGTELDRLPVRSFVQLYGGSASPANADAASTLPDSDYEPISGAALGLMQTRWYRLRLHNDSSEMRRLVLDFDQALYSRIEWRTQAGTDVRHFLTGQDYPYDSRDIRYNYFAFQLDIPPGETLTADFAIYTPYAALFVPLLSDEDNFSQRMANVWQFSGAVIGMLYAVALFLLIYIVRMPRLGAAHAMLAQVAFSTLSVLYLTGIFQQWLPEESRIAWRDVSYLLIHGPQGLGYILAVRAFFQTAVHYPLVNRMILALAGITTLHFPLLFVVPVEALLVSLLATNTAMMFCSTVVAVLSLWRRQEGTALFALGLLSFLLLSFISIAGTVGILPGSFLTRYGYELGLTVQADFLFLAIATRIFTMERQTLQMQQQMLQLDAEMKARSEFVDRVTHDLKSPLSAVIGATQLLRDKTDPQERQGYLDIIQRSCGMVIGIIDDILTHSRMKSRGLTLHLQPFDMRELVASIESSVQASRQASHVHFSVKVDDALPRELYGDRLRIGQLLNNLLTNAFKFTDEGRVLLSVELAARQPDSVDVRFVVQDTGIGMSSEFLQQAFEPYTREESGKGYRQGFGLGLSICRQLVDLMGGTIDVLSAVGQGTRFTVVIPLALNGD